MARLARARHKEKVSSESDDPGQSPDDGLVIFPGPTVDPLPVREDIVWFDPDSLAQRSAIGKQARRPGWWCPQDLEPDSARTPCWGAVQPALCPSLGKRSELWNDPELAFVHRWSRSQALAMSCAQRGSAYALLDQMLESLVVANLFEREPEPHRALLVTERSAHAWWKDLLARWAHTSTPEGHPIQASHPDFASHWLLVSYDVWDQDQEQLCDWLTQSDAQQAIGFHLPGSQLPWVNLAGQGRSWALEAGVKYLVAGQEQDLDALAWDPRDRITLVPNASSSDFGLLWDNEQRPCATMHFDPESGAYYL